EALGARLATAIIAGGIKESRAAYAEDLFHFVRVQAHSQRCGDQRANAGSYSNIRLVACFVKNTPCADMCTTSRSASTKDYAVSPATKQLSHTSISLPTHKQAHVVCAIDCGK